MGSVRDTVRSSPAANLFVRYRSLVISPVPLVRRPSPAPTSSDPHQEPALTRWHSTRAFAHMGKRSTRTAMRTHRFCPRGESVGGADAEAIAPDEGARGGLRA